MLARRAANPLGAGEAENITEEGNVEHSKEYPWGRYHVVEQIEKVKDGFRFSVTAYDD